MPNSTFTAGRHWTGAAISEGGNFLYCAISATYNDTMLMFGLTKNFTDFMISLSEPNWSLPTGQILYATISLDGNFGDTYKGVAATSSMITFHFQPDADFVKALALGRTLRIVSSKERWTFNLLGTEDAMPQLVKCTTAYSDADGQNNPFDTQKPMGSNPFDVQKKPVGSNPFDAR